ncbi:GvpL/GvpF family gas vesicle protein [Anaerosacchariphilus polymeriproducens]|nr:GvpL/GvpF family gas vesicle protein [Anaerosacchariphilus polymeriproducens]
MDYLNIALLLQESGKEVNVTNIKKVLNVLDREAEDEKIQYFVSILSMLSPKNKEEKRLNHDKIKELPVDTQIKKTEETHQVENVYQLENEYQMENVLQMQHNQPGRYVYGIAGKGTQENLGNIGLDGAEVYTIPYKEACIVVHDCQAEPYKSEDENVVKEWLFTQQEVLDIAAEKFDGVLPMSFDMIIEGKSGSNPENEAISWLEKNYESFMETILKIKNCQEYGIQVILNTLELSQTIFETDEKLKKKKEEINAKPEGIAYMEKEMLKDLVKERIEEKADEYFKKFYEMIKKYPDDIVIGKVKKVGDNQQMLMNLSCLVHKDKVGPLGEELELIDNYEGITVRFSGPWAPYSFVTPEKGAINSGNG